MASLIVYNGNFLNGDKPFIGADNRSFRYGDGLFETMKIINGKLLLADLHFERLFAGMRQLRFEPPRYFTPYYFMDLISKLCIRNHTEEAARIRMMVFRGDGGPYHPVDHYPNFVIQSAPLQQEVLSWNEKGFQIDVFPDARKSCDGFANLKSNNYLPYLMAALYAKEKKLDDCIVMNSHGRIADATIANVFLIKDSTVCTPALSEGCVAGVMRRHLIMLLRENSFRVEEEGTVRVESLLQADEIFLTNALYSVRWVGAFRDCRYSGATAREIYQLLQDSLT